MSFEEVMAERKLNSLREKMLDKDSTLLTHDFRKKISKILDSDLYKCLYRMPKPAVHHLHMTATVSTEFLVELTYDYRVWYSEKTNLFKVSEKPITEPGYM